MLKLLAKIAYLEQIISYKLIFLNKEYRSNKDDLADRLNETSTKYSKLLGISDKLIMNEKENIYKMKVNKTINQKNQTNDSKLKTKLKEKLDTLLIFKNDLEEEIFYIKENFVNKLNNYSSQIDEIVMDNNRLERILLDLENFKEENINKIILEKRLKIADKYRLIRDQVGKINQNDNLKTSHITINNYMINDVI